VRRLRTRAGDQFASSVDYRRWVTSVSFALVDVFADEPLSGNPLAVVPDADHLSEDLLPRIAREFNQAETTFLLTPTAAGADHRLRSFTAAGVEVFGARHNALGAWWWLGETGRLDRLGLWHQQVGPAVLPVDVSRERVAMRQERATIRGVGRARGGGGRVGRRRDGTGRCGPATRCLGGRHRCPASDGGYA
jgi:hypothetical protein